MSKTFKQKDCTAKVFCINGNITTVSCNTGKRLIDKGGNYEGTRDDYECPDCGKFISIYYED